MGRKQASTPRLTRRDKILQERMRAASPVSKFDTASPRPLPRLEARNNKQREAIAHLLKGTPVVFLTGSAGTGKSLLATWRAANLLNTKVCDKLYLVRPAVSVGKSIGLLPGEIKDKLGPYFAQTITHLEFFLGAPTVRAWLADGKIEMHPVEYLRGRSFENCVVIAEEVQNFTAEELEMMLTRGGEGCTMLFTGDTKQHDLKGSSGLDLTIQLIERMLQGQPEYMTDEELDDLDDGVAVIKFTPDDVVRSGLTKAFVKMFYFND